MDEDEVAKIVADRVKTYDNFFSNPLGYALPFRSPEGEHKWALYLNNYNPFNPPKKAEVVFPRGFDFQDVIDKVKEDFERNYKEIKNAVEDLVNSEELKDMIKGMKRCSLNDIWRILKHPGTTYGYSGILVGALGPFTLFLMGFPGLALLTGAVYLPAGLLAGHSGIRNAIEDSGYRNKCLTVKILAEGEEIKKEWENVLEPEYWDELERIKNTVVCGEEWDGEISLYGYRACKGLLKSDIPMHPDCKKSYEEIARRFEKSDRYQNIRRFVKLNINGKITVLENPDVVDMYKNDPEQFKDYFHYQISDMSENIVLKVMEKIAKLEDRNEELDEWLTCEYSELSKKAGRMIV